MAETLGVVEARTAGPHQTQKNSTKKKKKIFFFFLIFNQLVVAAPPPPPPTTRPIYDCCSILQLMMIWPMSQATKRRPSIISCPYCGS